MLKELEKLLAEIARQQGIDMPQKQPPQRAAAARRRAEMQPMEAIIIEAEPVREDLRSHVARTVDTSDITQHATHLGDEVAQSDDRLEARLHQKFDHELGGISENAYDEKVVDPTARGAAGEIAEMFRDARSTRQAILLNEILTRPVDRW